LADIQGIGLEAIRRDLPPIIGVVLQELLEDLLTPGGNVAQVPGKGFKCFLTVLALLSFSGAVIAFIYPVVEAYGYGLPSTP
jgi:hypothetical protein